MKEAANTPALTRRSVSELGVDASGLLEALRESHHPVVLTEKERDVAVVVALESYLGLIDELMLLRDIRRGLADVEAGRVMPHEEVRKVLAERYAS